MVPVRPVYLKLHGFHSYVEPCELNLEQAHMVAIQGQIGAGKSSLIDAMLFALFGAYRTPDIDGIISSDSDTAEVDLQFEMDNQRWRVWRKRWRANRSQASLYCLVDGEWQPQGGQTLADVQAAIVRLLGVTERTFVSTVLLGQDDASRFTSASTPQQRRQILSEILGLQLYDQVSSSARALARDKQAEADVSQAALRELSAVAEALPSLQQRLAEAQAAAKVAADKADHLKALSGVDRAERIQSLQKTITALNALLRNVQNLTNRKEGISEQVLSVEKLSEQEEPLRAALESNANSLDLLWMDLQSHLASKAALDGQLEMLAQVIRSNQAAIAGYSDELAKMEGLHDPSCPTCGQPMHGAAYEHAKQSLESKISWNNDTMAIAQADLAPARAGLKRVEADIRQQHDQISEIQRESGRLQQQLQQVVESQRSLPALRQQLADIESEIDVVQGQAADIGDQQKLQGQLSQLVSQSDKQVSQQQVLAAQAEYGELERQVGELIALVKAAQEATDGLAALREENDKIRAEARAAQLVSDACGKSGVPTQIFNTKTGQLQRETDRVLEWLGSPYRVRFVTRKVTKSGKVGAETLDIAIVAPDAERDYNSYSGGEKFQIDLAIRMGLSQMLMQRSGRAIRMLVLDEGWGKMDETGIQAMLQCLKKISSQFPFIATITHTQAVADAFPERIEVEKDPQRGSKAVLVLPD